MSEMCTRIFEYIDVNYLRTAMWFFGETFGGELLIYAWIKGFRMGEYICDPLPRRSSPRMGETLKAYARIFAANMKLSLYLIFKSIDLVSKCWI